MKVLHCCLAAVYVEGYGYQENVLPRLHKLQGHSVEIVASTETYLENTRFGYIQAGSYISSDGIRVTRLPYVSWMPAWLARKLRCYRGLKELIERIEPDVIFLHDCQFLDIGRIARYASLHNTTVYVDSHTDHVNSGRTWISKFLLHRLIYRYCAQLIEPVTTKFFPTLPLRGAFLHEIYGIPKEKMELLPFGADDSSLDWNQRENIRNEIRAQLGLNDGQVVFITGGKIDARKNIHLLLKVFTEKVQRGELPFSVLMVFGEPDDEMKDVVGVYFQSPAVRSVGWIPADKVHQYLWAADVGVFPGTHSVLWEEAIGLGVPCVFKEWVGLEHLDVGGNCLFLNEVSEASIGNVLQRLVDDPKLRLHMRNIALEQGVRTFSYSQIALRSLPKLDI